jgi:diguanylate cyclase (GGDEF)-like protein/PAS domain S-box-containing protein
MHFAQGRETFNLWAGLLSVALDHEAVLHSLRHQREDLASSYQRERQLVTDIGVSEQRYALAARAANDGLWDWDFQTGTIYYSPRWKALLGYAEDAITDDPAEWFSRVHVDDKLQFEQALERHRGDPTTPWEHECRMQRADGTYSWMLCRGLVVNVPGGPVTRMVGSLTDVTDRVELETRLRHDALYDNLTGLPNRALFLERLDRAVELAKRRPDYQFAVLFLDLDGFKVVNDSLGHLAGNELLIGIAKRLQLSLRTNDTAARFGGDEFAVLLNDVKRTSDITLVAERLQAELSAPFTLDGHQVVVSAGIGIAASGTGYNSAEDVLRDADIAMYRAKGSGHGQHVVFDVAMHERAVRRLRLETDLRGAIDRSEFVLHYQPIVRLGDGSVAAYEALIRWQSPERGLVSPADFLPLAEETGLIVPIGRWVLATAAAQVAAWRREGHDVAVSVNVSNRQFWHGDLVEQVREVLALHSLSPVGLRLEITEGVVMHKPGPAERMLQDIARLGVALDVDDFGTGYSSLEVLHRFPIAALKIDRSFVVRIEQDVKSGELVRAIVMMAISLGMDVVAEGIETETQDAYLRTLGCSYGQGYLYGRPVPANEIDHEARAVLRIPTAR